MRVSSSYCLHPACSKLVRSRSENVFLEPRRLAPGVLGFQALACYVSNRRFLRFLRLAASQLALTPFESSDVANRVPLLTCGPEGKLLKRDAQRWHHRTAPATFRAATTRRIPRIRINHLQ
ncbi:hypothetical protein MTO96_034846, partial [Rhipicephalus appendiculatus]